MNSWNIGISLYKKTFKSKIIFKLLTHIFTGCITELIPQAKNGNSFPIGIEVLPLKIELFTELNNNLFND